MQANAQEAAITKNHITQVLVKWGVGQSQRHELRWCPASTLQLGRGTAVEVSKGWKPVVAPPVSKEYGKSQPLRALACVGDQGFGFCAKWENREPKFTLRNTGVGERNLKVKVKYGIVLVRVRVRGDQERLGGARRAKDRIRGSLAHGKRWPCRYRMLYENNRRIEDVNKNGSQRLTLIEVHVPRGFIFR